MGCSSGIVEGGQFYTAALTHALAHTHIGSRVIWNHTAVACDNAAQLLSDIDTFFFFLDNLNAEQHKPVQEMNSMSSESLKVLAIIDQILIHNNLHRRCVFTLSPHDIIQSPAMKMNSSQASLN